MPVLTLVRVPEGDDTTLTKVITTEGSTEIPQLPFLVQFSSVEVATVRELHEALEELGEMPDVCVIRAEPIEPDDDTPRRRLIIADKRTGDAATLRPVARDWVLIDFDSVPSPAGLDFTKEPARAAQHVRGLLPACFQESACVWRASSSAGLKPGIRVHLWFLLSTPVDTEQLTAWLSGFPVDAAVFRANQPHFTAHPRFVDRADPMSARLGVLDGGDRVIVPELQTIQPKRALPAITPLSGLDPFTARALRQWDADHPAPSRSGSERFECPACGSSDGLAELPDGKWFCHSSKHAELAPTIGNPTRTPGGTGYVGHRFEFVTTTSWRDVPARLVELGYRKPAELKAPAAAEQAIDEALTQAATGAAPTVKELDRARRELAAAEKVVRATPSQLAIVAEQLGKLCPSYLDADAVRAKLVDAAVNGAPRGLALTAPAAEATVDKALAVGAAKPKQLRKARSTGPSLQTDEQGNLLICYANVLALISMQELAECLAYNELAGEIWLETAPWVPYADDRAMPRPIDDADLSWLVAMLAQHYEYPHATTEQVFKAIAAVASERVWNPVQQYLNEQEWSGSTDDAREYLRALAAPLLGCKESDYNSAVFMRWCIAAVQRAFEPGCQWREMMTLVGPQDKGKSTAIRELCDDETWFLEDMDDFRGREAKSALRGKWICELSEVDKATTGPRADAAALKSFMSRRIDRYRTAYDKFDKDHPRRSVMFGTANPFELLTDPTGNTRFLIIDVGEPNIALAREVRSDLWAAARTLYEAGEPAYLQGTEKDDARQAQDAHYASSDVEEALTDLFEAPAPAKARGLPIAGGSKGFTWTADQVGDDGRFTWLTGQQIQDFLRDRGLSGRVGRSAAGSLRRLGLIHGRASRTSSHPRMRSWGRPTCGDVVDRD